MKKQELIDAVMEGKQISNYSYWIWKNSDGTFHGQCADENCCDDDFKTLDEALELWDIGQFHICTKITTPL